MTAQLFSKTLYDEDFNLWVEQTVQQVRSQQIESLDWEHLIEEIEALGAADKRELRKRVTLIMSHILCLLFWLPESERQECARGWRLTIREQRRQVKQLLKDSPSLKPYLTSLLESCYEDAREDVIYKSPLYWDIKDLISDTLPFTLTDILEEEY
ncbi:MAG: DUF29 domain-containing protein [Snowella sp.]|nr:DUF29 domain-containing protein [Snowella sp.]